MPFSVSRVAMESKIAEFCEEIGYQEGAIQLLTDTLDNPIYHEEHYGFRYRNPGPAHFCLLKAIRCVSALRAIMVLLRSGFTQEIAVLIRSIVENTTHIEFVLVGYEEGRLGEPQQRYVSEYFADCKRDQTKNYSKLRVRQLDVHKLVGSSLDDQISRSERAAEFRDVDSAKLMSNQYLCYSNYVHSRYPEVMDLYGGGPPRFHLRGMSNTPKDAENLDTVEAFIVAVSNALRQMLLKLELRKELQSHPELARWYLFEAGLAAGLDKSGD